MWNPSSDFELSQIRIRVDFVGAVSPSVYFILLLSFCRNLENSTFLSNCFSKITFILVAAQNLNSCGSGR